jgi:glycosyltransferase involved in cell wall biosynthesis
VVDGYPEIQAKRRILWTHDLPHNGFIPNPKTINAFHAVVFMSDFARKIWSDFYPPIRNIRSRHFKIPNGVDREIFRPGIKDLNYIIYASAPNRGLKRLPLLLDAIRSKLSSKIHLKAFSNLQVLHPNEVGDNPDEFQGIYKTVEESSVELHDPLPQRQFAIELGRAGLMLLPTDYPEICSNAVIQSLACGTPVISTGGIGSIGEWVTDGYNGRLTGYRPTDYMVYQVELVRAMVDMMSSDTEHRKYVARTSRTNLKSWDQVASLWDQMIRKIS